MTHTPVRWQVRIDAAASIVYVETRLHLHDGDRLALPAWIPGSYLVREFARGLQDLRVETLDGQPVRLEHPDKASWLVRIETPQELVLRYAVYGRELSVRTAHIDDTHAFFNGANVFLAITGREASPQQVSIAVPEGWSSFVSLPAVDGAFQADNYVHLADTVFECGPHKSHRFEVEGVPHRMVFWDPTGVVSDLATLEADCRALIAQNRTTFQSPLPYDRYDLVFHVTPSARGGLEHRDSTTLATPWAAFETSAGYLDMLTLIAHEHFHAYNGRRLAPKALEAVDYSRENFLDELWVIEGFTSYFDELNTLRAGRMTQAQWLERSAKAFTALFRTFGRTRQSLRQASHDAWIRLYRPYEHTRNQTVSYYLKGSLVALAIDLRMRAQTKGERGLEAVLQELWRRWRDHHTHYTSEDVIDVIADLSDASVAADAARWISTTEEPPYAELLATHGLALAEVPAKDGEATFGFTTDLSLDSPVIVSIDEALRAELDALRPGDELVAIDGRRVRSQELLARLGALTRDGATPTCALTIFRHGHERRIEITLRALPTLELTAVDEAEHTHAAGDLRARLFAAG